MRRGCFFIFLFQLFSVAPDLLWAAPATVSYIRYHYYPTYTRIVLDMDRPPRYHVERLDGEPRSRSIVVRLPDTTLTETLRNQPILLLQGQLEKIEVREEQDLLIILNLKNHGEYKAMVLTNPDRLVLDVFSPPDEKTVSVPVVPPVPSAPPPPVLLSEPAVPALPPVPLPPVSAINTIVLDPGHGGDAPGAIGPTGLTEAEIVLDVAFRVKDLLEQKLHKKVILTRDRDASVSLSDRTKIANEHEADLFVSIHANASTKRAAHGIETYIFGRAANKGDLETAARENATDVKAAQNMQDVILSDLLRDFTVNEALELAHYTQEAFVHQVIPEYPTKSLGVKKAPFYVLAHTRMPAILAEISFVSNPMEEERLRKGSYRQKVAESIFRGVQAYIEEKK